MLIRLFSTTVIALGLTACALPPARVALTPDVKQLEEVKVNNIVGQDEIVMRAQAFGATGALGGGLLGAVIDSKVGESRQNTIQLAMKPFYSAVDDVDFRKDLTAALTSALEQGTPFAKVAVESGYLLPPPQTEARRVELGARRGLLELGTAYTFSADFTKLTVSTRALMQMPGADKPTYLNTFYYESGAVGAGGPASLQTWADNQGEQYRAITRDAIAQLVKMLKLDLVAGAVDPEGAAKASANVNMPMKIAVNGAVLDSDQGRIILRAANGNLYSIKQ